MGDADGQAAYKKSARSLWFIDWSDIKIGIAGTNAVTRKSPHPDIQKEYRCRMAHKETEYLTFNNMDYHDGCTCSSLIDREF